MEKDNLTRKDMEAYLGNKARVSDVLNRRRPLSLSMIRRLNQGLGIPADLLISLVSRDSGKRRPARRRSRDHDFLQPFYR